LEIITTAGSVDVTNVSNIDRILYTIGGTNTITGALSGVIIDGTSGTALGLTLGAGTNTVTLENIIAASTFTGNTGADTITYTGSVATSVAGVAGNDVLTTGTGNDTLNGGDGADAMTGGTGNNVFVYSSATNSSGANVDTIADFNSGDVLQLALTMTGTTFTSTDRGAVATLGDSGGNLTGVAGDMVFITGTSQLAVDTDGNGTISGTDYRIALTGNTVVPTGAGVTFNITGTAGNDAITTGAGADTISGLGGNDLITGNAGNDDITAGAGLDTILGGSGADTIALGGGAEADVIRYSQAAGADGGTTLATADTITGFVTADDTIAITGALKTAIDLSGANAITDAKTSTGAANNVATATTTELLFSVTANSALATANFGDMTAVATALNAMFNFTNGPTGPVLALIAGGAATAHALYLYTETGAYGDNSVSAAELVLLGVITSDAALAATTVTIA
jgi:Ca2+-binding RTX toxin-like protein